MHIIVILALVASITIFGLSGYALGEIVEPFVHDNTNGMNNTNEKSNMKLDITWANEKNSLEDEYFSVR